MTEENGNQNEKKSEAASPNASSTNFSTQLANLSSIAADSANQPRKSEAADLQQTLGNQPSIFQNTQQSLSQNPMLAFPGMYGVSSTGMNSITSHLMGSNDQTHAAAAVLAAKAASQSTPNNMMNSCVPAANNELSLQIPPNNRSISQKGEDISPGIVPSAPAGTIFSPSGSSPGGPPSQQPAIPVIPLMTRTSALPVDVNAMTARMSASIPNSMNGIVGNTGTAMTGTMPATNASIEGTGRGQQYRDFSRAAIDDIQCGLSDGVNLTKNNGDVLEGGGSSDILSVDGDGGGGAPSGKEPPFPVKLHKILSNTEFKDVITWLPHGRSWRVLKPKAFEEKVIPLYFRHAKYASFMRQVNGWGFKRITQGPDHNSYYHELFLRGLPRLCLKMRRPARAKSASSDSDINPDFYRISMIAPLPNVEGNSPTIAARNTEGVGNRSMAAALGGSSSLVGLPIPLSLGLSEGGSTGGLPMVVSGAGPTGSATMNTSSAFSSNAILQKLQQQQQGVVQQDVNSFSNPGSAASVEGGPSTSCRGVGMSQQVQQMVSGGGGGGLPFPGMGTSFSPFVSQYQPPMMNPMSSAAAQNQFGQFILDQQQHQKIRSPENATTAGRNSVDGVTAVDGSNLIDLTKPAVQSTALTQMLASQQPTSKNLPKQDSDDGRTDS